MDINTAESQIKKLLAYVSDIDERRPTMYQKSKDRLRDLANNCVQVVKIISSIIQDESLAQDYNGFESDDNYDMKAALESIEGELTKVRKLIGYKSEDTSQPDESKKKLFSIYRQSLSKEYKYDNCAEVSRCCKLIQDWFTVRFLGKQPDGFHYTLKSFPSMLVSIVVVYGYNVQVSKSDEFVQSFYTWLDSVKSGESMYCLPYFVYTATKEELQGSLTAVVLWDVLCNTYLKTLVDDHLIRSDTVYDSFANSCPEVLDCYRDYRYDESILSECKLREVLK